MADCGFCWNSLTDAQFLLVNGVIYKSCPECSKKSNEHIHYLCPEAFGTTQKRYSANNPMGLQSHCSQCRASKAGPHKDAFPCSRVSNENGYIIPEIRFLPMGKAVFDNDEKARDFILNAMPKRGGTFYYQITRVDCPRHTLVMFQYNGKLIGYAVFLEAVEWTEAMEDEGSTYYGYYQFAPGSIRLLNEPISASEFAIIDLDFKSFNQSCQRKPAGLLLAIFGIINRSGCIQRADDSGHVLPEEYDEADAANLKEGAKKQITVNAYERNPLAREKCIEYYRKLNRGRVKCEICGFDFGKVYGEAFAEKTHIHHLIEISTVGQEYEVNAIEDLLPICPNCHMIAHSRKPAYSPDEIKQMIGRNKNG